MTPSVMQLLPLLEGMGNHLQGLQEAYLGLQIIKVVCEWEWADFPQNRQNTGVREIYFLNYFCCGLSDDSGFHLILVWPLPTWQAVDSLVISFSDPPPPSGHLRYLCRGLGHWGFSKTKEGKALYVKKWTVSKGNKCNYCCVTITPKLSGLKNGKHLLSLKVSREEFGSGLARWFWLEVSYHFATEMSAWAAVLLRKVAHSILENRVVVSGHWGWGEGVGYSGAVRGDLGGCGTCLDLDMASWLYEFVCQNLPNCIQGESGESGMSISKAK